MVILSIGNRRVYTLEQRAKETLNRLSLLYNKLSSVRAQAEAIEKYDRIEENNPKLKDFKEYESWVANEFKTEERIKQIAKELIDFEKKLWAIEESMERNAQRSNAFESYPNLRHQYNELLKKEIDGLKWLDVKVVKEVFDAQKEILNEKRYETKFPAIAQEIRRKNGNLYVQSVDIHSVLSEIRAIRDNIVEQEKLTKQ